jgi:hypothetical protein
MNYEAYVLTDDYETRRKLIEPLIIEEMVKETKKEDDWKAWYNIYFYTKHYTHKDAKIEAKKTQEKELQETIKGTTIHIKNLLDEMPLGVFLYYGDKHLKSKMFMLRYMLYLTELNDRIMIYDAYKQKKSIKVNVIKRLYNDINYKFVTLRLPYTRQEQDEYHKNQGMYSIDYLDDKREKQGLFTRRQMIDDELNVNPNDLFVKILPKSILEKNTQLINCLKVF